MKLSLSFNCPMKWEELQGGDDRRYCASCDKHVVNLSNMAPTAARMLVAKSGGNLCVRAAARPDGTVLFGARAARATAMAAALTVAPHAMADGSIPDLTAVPVAEQVEAPPANPTATDTTGDETEVATTDAMPTGDEDGHATTQMDPDAEAEGALIDVDDDDCAGAKKPDDEMIYMLGGI